MSFFRAKKIHFICICVAFVTVMFFVANVGFLPCPDIENGRKQPKGHAYKTREQDLANREQTLMEWENRLRHLETALRTTFPQKLELIEKYIHSDIPTIYVITPTYARPVQKAELTRLKNTFLHVRNFHWIIVEDSHIKTELIINFLASSGLKYTHLNIATPADYKLQSDDPNWLKPRGVLQRNKALEWIRINCDPSRDKGVIFFGDDDNTYDLKLFEEMRYTEKVSVWPVALVGRLRYESPIIVHGKVTGWFTYWKTQRPFAMDMAGFAINLQLLFDHPKVVFSLYVKRGYQESSLLTGLVTMEELEPKADNCTKILVWHTRTERVNFANEDKFKARGLPGSDPKMEI